MKILLTGATGFVGSHLAEELVNRGHEVFALVRATSQVEFLKSIGIKLIVGDLDSVDQSAIDLPPIDAVIHLAGLIKARSRYDFYRTNTEGTRRLLNLLQDQELKRFIFVSSIAARGPNVGLKDFEGKGPVSDYGRSKLMAEQIVMQVKDQFPVTILRPPIVYGPRDKETGAFFKMFKKGFFPLIGSGKQRVSFIFVTDLVSVLVACLEKGEDLGLGGLLRGPLGKKNMDGSGKNPSF